MIAMWDTSQSKLPLPHRGRGSGHDRAHSSRVGFFFACFLAIRIFICNFAERITKLEYNYEEGNETVTNCHQLKLRAADGKMRLTIDHRALTIEH